MHSIKPEAAHSLAGVLNELDADDEYYVEFTLDQALATIRAAKFIHKERRSLNEEETMELWAVRQRVGHLLAIFTDGDGYGDLPPEIIQVMRGYEADASALLKARMLS